MKNAHERFGRLEFTKRLKDTTTEISLHLDRFIGEIDPKSGDKRAHLISVFGGDSDVAAAWAAVLEGGHFTVEGPDFKRMLVSLGRDARCFRGSIALPGRKRPVRHLVAISAALVQTSVEGNLTSSISFDATPAFVLCRIAQRFGLAVLPEWAGWFMDELRRQTAIRPLVGLGCSPVVVLGTKKTFLNWIGRALRRRQIEFPSKNGPITWPECQRNSAK